MNEIWTDEDEGYLREHADRLTDAEVAAALTRRAGRPVSLAAVRRKRQKLGIVKARGRGVCRVEARKQVDR